MPSQGAGADSQLVVGLICSELFKSSTTYTPKFFRHLDTVAEELGVERERRVVVYDGEESFETSHGLVCTLTDLSTLEL